MPTTFDRDNFTLVGSHHTHPVIVHCDLMISYFANLAEDLHRFASKQKPHGVGIVDSVIQKSSRPSSLWIRIPTRFRRRRIVPDKSQRTSNRDFHRERSSDYSR